MPKRKRNSASSNRAAQATLSDSDEMRAVRFEVAVGVVFCSRCGTRFVQPRPAAIREYALNCIVRSWWHFAREFVMAFAMCAGGLFLLRESPGHRLLGSLLVLGSIILVRLAVCARRGMTWSLTSDRLIERRDLFASSH